MGTTSREASRRAMRWTSWLTISSAQTASRSRCFLFESTTCWRSSISYTKALLSSLTAGSMSRGTAISTKNMGRFLRAASSRSACSLRTTK